MWSEYVGTFVKLELSESEVSVVLLCRNEHLVLSFPKDDEALQMKLSSLKPGVRIGVLRTDKSFHVRTIKIAQDGTHSEYREN
jgi:hypothetical protein